MYRHNHMLTRLLQTEFLNKLPDELQYLNDMNDVPMVETPDLEKVVFIRVLENIDYSIRVGMEDIMLEKGGIYSLRYRSVKELLRIGSVELI